MAENETEFPSRDAALITISTDDLDDAIAMSTLTLANFSILSDSDHAVADDYEVFDLLGDGVAAPATFIIGRGREILWSQIGENIADRPSTSKILGELDRLFG